MFGLRTEVHNMMSEGNETPKGTPASFTHALDDSEWIRDFPQNVQNLDVFSRGLPFSSNFHQPLEPPTVPGHGTGTEALSRASDPRIAPLISPTFAGLDSAPSPMAGNELGHPMRHGNREESVSEHPASQDDAQSPTQAELVLHQATPPTVHQRHNYGPPTYHHPYPGHSGPYVRSAHHSGMGHSPPPPFVYHGYHHAFSPPPVSPGAGQGSFQAPFPGGMHPPLHYSSHSEYAYRHPGYPPSSAPLYPQQYGQPSYQASVEPHRQGMWWYMVPGPPLSPPHIQVTRPYHPGFQRSYSYPFLPLIPSSADSSHSAPTTSQASRSSPASREGLSPSSHDLSPQLEDTEESSGTAEKPLVRRSYHPRPPIERSDWTMWAGNVPLDATSRELRTFFSQLASVSRSEITETEPVVSVFLINRSNCAFINYDTEPHLNEAIAHFNGKPLRPNDSRCPRLLCRVRKKDEDLKSGVGGQRGTGMHTKWVKEQRMKKLRETASESPSVRVMSSLSLSSSDEDHRRRTKAKQSSSSGSYTSSTSSSFFARNFPRRYFILKSLTQHDLDLSVKKGLWATQKHNEGVLDQAFRTSQEVLLVFGVNKSGEFYGFGRMAGPIQSGEQRVAWEARKTSTPSSREELPPLILSPSDHRLVDESPQDVMSQDAEQVMTAPAEVGQRKRLSVSLPPARHTYEAARVRKEIKLDPEAPKRAMRQRETIAEEGEAWGQSFRVEWLSTERLAFNRIRHLKNPWNHERELKVSRDGTELEPIVGQKLLEEWHELATTTTIT